jgi:orotate phosphoribosyltransferase
VEVSSPHLSGEIILDDVIITETANREAISKIRNEWDLVVAVFVALDRMEKLPAPDDNGSTPMLSAVGLRRDYGILVFSILTLDNVTGGLRESRSGDVERRYINRVKYVATK